MSRASAHSWSGASVPRVHDAGQDDHGQARVQLAVEGAQEALPALAVAAAQQPVPHPGLPQARGAVPVWLPARRAVRGLDISRCRQRTGGRVPEVPRLADGATRGLELGLRAPRLGHIRESLMAGMAPGQGMPPGSLAAT